MSGEIITRPTTKLTMTWNRNTGKTTQRIPQWLTPWSAAQTNGGRGANQRTSRKRSGLRPPNPH